MAFISLSIDLVGSTLAKQGIVLAAEGDMSKRNRYYREYLKLLFSIEREFYINLNNSFTKVGLDMSRLSMVKAIGDEYWFAIEVDEEDPQDVARVAWSLIECGFDCIAADRYLGISADNQSSFDEEAVSVLSTNFPIKVLIDVISDPIEITELRYLYLKDIFSILRQDSSTVFRMDDAFLSLCNRLNIGGSSVRAQGEALVARYDYIGLEIDRFFRLAKKTHPSILAIGANLFGFLDVEVAPVRADLPGIGIRQASISLPEHPLEEADAMDALLIEEKVSADELKGIGLDYTLFHLFRPETFEPSAYGMAPSASALSLLAPGFAFLAEHGYFLLDGNASTF